MPKRKTTPAGTPTFDQFTEACTHQRRRWKRDIIPEITVWLTVHAKRLSNALAHATRMAKESGLDESKAACSNLSVRLQFLGELILALHDQWGEGAHWEAVQDVLQIIRDSEQPPAAGKDAAPPKDA